MSNVNLIAEARRNAPESVDESLIMQLVVALEAAEPRAITTVEELDALPNWSAILDSSGDVAQKLNGWWHFPETSPVGPSKVLKYSATVTVIHEPTIEATR